MARVLLNTRPAPAEGRSTQYFSAESVAYCEGLALAGNSDWRLPSVGELATLVNVQTSAIPMIDREAFPDDESAIAVEF